MLITLPNPILELQHASLPLKVLRVRERASTPYYSAIFNLDSHLSPLRSLRVCHARNEELLRDMSNARNSKPSLEIEVS
jgi:hypothetical protein